MAPEERRAEIIRAAHRALEAGDPNTVTFEEIAAEAGVSRALVYSYFGDRGGLLAAVYQELLEPLDATFRAALTAEAPLAERWRHVVEAAVGFATDSPGGWHSVGLLAASGHPAVRAARAARISGLARELEGTPAPEAEVVTGAVIGLLESAIMNWLDDPTMPAERFTELLTGLVTSGVGYPTGPAVSLVSDATAQPG